MSILDTTVVYIIKAKKKAFYTIRYNNSRVTELYFADFRKNRYLLSTPFMFGSMIRKLKDFEQETDVDTLIKINKKLPRNISFLSDIPLEDRVVTNIYQGKISLAILGSVGGYGDKLMFLSAVKWLYDYLKKFFSEVSITIYGDFLERDLEMIPLYDNVDFYKNPPVSVEELKKYDFILSLSWFANYVLKAPISFSEFFKLMVGLEGYRDEKIGRIYYPIDYSVKLQLEDYLSDLKKKFGKIILVHPKASTKIRTMPEDYFEGLVNFLLENTEFAVATLFPLSVEHPRYLNLSDFSKSFNHYAYIISRMDGLITVETSAFHIADAFNIPTLLIATTRHGYLQAKDYPTVSSILLGKDDPDNPIINIHGSEKEEHAEYARSLWYKLDYETILEKFLKVFNKFSKIAGTPNYDPKEFPELDIPFTLILIPFQETNLEDMLLSSLGQNYSNLEVIVINAIKSKKLEDLIKTYSKKRQIVCENNFISALKSSKGKYVQVILNPVKLYQTSVKKIVNYMERKKVSILFSSYSVLNRNKNELWIQRFESLMDECGNILDFLYKDIPLADAFVFGREVLLNHFKGFNIIEDHESIFRELILLALKSSLRFKVAYYDSPTLHVFLSDDILKLPPKSMDNLLYSFFKSVDFEEVFPSLSWKEISLRIEKAVKKAMNKDKLYVKTLIYLLNLAQNLSYSERRERIIKKLSKYEED